MLLQEAMPAPTPASPDKLAPAGMHKADGNVVVLASLLRRDFSCRPGRRNCQARKKPLARPRRQRAGLGGIWPLRPEPGSRVVDPVSARPSIQVLPAKTASFAMADIKLLALAMDLRARAREMLSRDETIYDMYAQQTMRAVAGCPEKVAQRVEHDSVGGRPSSDTPR